MQKLVDETSCGEAIRTNVVSTTLGRDIEVGVGKVGVEEARAEDDLNHRLVIDDARVALS